MKTRLSSVVSLLTVLVLAFTIAIPAFAEEEHAPSTIIGTNIDLKTGHHEFSGKIRDWKIKRASFDEADATAYLEMTKPGIKIKAEFKKKEDINRFGGTITHKIKDKVYKTNITFEGVILKTNTFYYKINKNYVKVLFTYNNVEDNHYSGITYNTIIDGQVVNFTLRGMVCMELSKIYTMMILGAYAH